MNFKLLAVLCLVLVVLLPESECWRRRRRRRHCYQHCTPMGCSHWCSTNGNCGYYCTARTCTTICGKRRDEPEAQVVCTGWGFLSRISPPLLFSFFKESDEQNSPGRFSKLKIVRVTLPNKFADYDKNKDGRVDYQEFKKNFPPLPKDTEIRKIFRMVNKNGDYF